MLSGHPGTHGDRQARSTVPSFADMSSHQRAQSLDNMARQIADLTAANNRIVQRLNDLTEQNLALRKATELIAERIDHPRSFLGRWFGIC